MEHNGRRAAVPAIGLRALVPLTSREKEDRYWYDPGGRGGFSVAGGAARSFGFDGFGCADDGFDIAWSCVNLRYGH